MEPPSYLQNYHDAEDDEQVPPGTALQVVKEKWSELGPLRLEEIMANSSEPID